MLSASDRDEDLLRCSSLVVGHPWWAKKPGEESGWMETWSLLEVLRLLKHFLMLLCFFWRRWPWLELLPNVSSRFSSNCLSSIKYLNLLLSWHFSCHVELKLFVYISVFFTVNSCGLRAVSELYFASSVSSTVRGHNRLWLKEWIKAFHVIGCGYNELECCGSMWALVHFFFFTFK